MKWPIFVNFEEQMRSSQLLLRFTQHEQVLLKFHNQTHVSLENEADKHVLLFLLCQILPVKVTFSCSIANIVTNHQSLSKSEKTDIHSFLTIY